MNERYMFRGKRTDNGEWVQGYYCAYRPGIGGFSTPPKHIIFDVICGKISYFVDPDTIGQCTGLLDERQKLIFEGDVLGCYDLLCRDFFTGVVSFGDGSFVIKDEETTHYRWLDYETEILGNIHDNPELLEKDGDGE